jgi:Icc-related predicted phosphoesterase
MKFLAVSDLHGYLPTITEEFDLLMICGDVCFDNGIRGPQVDYIKTTFVDWVNSLPFKNPWSKVILVPGNHDGCFDGAFGHSDKIITEHKTGGHLVILNHDMYEFEYPVSDGIDSLTIFGTPYCKRFGTWPFMVDNDILDKKLSQIPENVDILLSHDSPNIDKLGAVLDENSRFYDPSAGSNILAKHIERIKPIIFHSGHMHSGNHEFHKNGDTWMANVSYVNENIEPHYGVLSYNFNEETKEIYL